MYWCYQQGGWRRRVCPSDGTVDRNVDADKGKDKDKGIRTFEENVQPKPYRRYQDGGDDYDHDHDYGDDAGAEDIGLTDRPTRSSTISLSGIHQRIVALTDDHHDQNQDSQPYERIV